MHQTGVLCVGLLCDQAALVIPNLEVIVTC